MSASRATVLQAAALTQRETEPVNRSTDVLSRIVGDTAELLMQPLSDGTRLVSVVTSDPSLFVSRYSVATSYRMTLSN